METERRNIIRNLARIKRQLFKIDWAKKLTAIKLFDERTLEACFLNRK